jgi:WD40 repeat protein
LTICVYDQSLVCGCSDGVIRVFKADTFEYVITLHRPPPLGKANIDSSSKKINISVTHDEKFADVIALVYNYNSEKLVALYSDKTFFIWDLKKSEKLYVYRYSTYHSGTINSMDLQTTSDDVLRIATCSDDRTVKFWNIKLEDFPGVNIHRGIFYITI